MSNGRMNLNSRCNDPLLTIVLPVYNEVEGLQTLVEKIEQSITPLAIRHELLFINDGSDDGSDELLDEMAEFNPAIRVLHLSRNFGHQPALQAGLSHAGGDAVVVMDSDLQDDPAAIPEFLRHWKQGYDVVFAIRTDRKESRVKRALFFAFYRILNAISRTPMPKDAGNFGLVDGNVIRNITSLTENDRFFPGLRSWVGYRQIGIPVERHARHDDRPRVSLPQLFQLAKTAIFSFSALPLSIFYLFGLASLVLCGVACSFTLYHKLFTQEAVPGWTSMVMVASFFGAVNALGIGVLGEYVIRIYDQVRQRPLFLVARKVNFETRGRDRTQKCARMGSEGASAQNDVDVADVAAAASSTTPVSLRGH